MAISLPFQFSPGDQEYLRWLSEHPDGYVLTSNHGLTPRHTVIHRTWCESINEYKGKAKPGAFTERRYLKVFGSDIASLEAWVLQQRPDGNSRVHACKVRESTSPVPPIEQRFVFDGAYTKADIYRLCEIPTDRQGGAWNTGYARWKGVWFIFCNIGTAGRTGHDYANRFVGDELVWFGKTGARADQPSIAEMLDPGKVVLVFYREADRDPFTFHGRVKALGYQDSDPVCIRWAFVGSGTERPEVLAHEVIDSGETYAEGAVKRITINAYERNPQARNACIRAHGIACVICAFNFEHEFGDIGVNYVHVHHLRPISQIGSTYTLNPVDDLRPVCPNCHAMLHRRNPPYSIGELTERRRRVAETTIGAATYSGSCKPPLIPNE